MSQPNSFLDLAGTWLLDSGIQLPEGGVARYYRSDVGTNRRVSTEITGYAVSAFAFLHRLTSQVRYLDAAGRAARFLARTAWDREREIFPFEYSDDGDQVSGLAYFFDSGIVARGLLAAWRATGDAELLAAAVRSADAMARDFGEACAPHPILRLPDKAPVPREGNWSRHSGCYQLKSALAWYDVYEATGQAPYLDYYEQALEYALSTHQSFLPGDADPHRVMDRLHAYSYFLEGLLPRLDRAECASAMRWGLPAAARLLREISPGFERSDVCAQILRARLYADSFGVVPLDREAAEEEARRAASYQVRGADRRAGGLLVRAAKWRTGSARQPRLDGILPAGAGHVAPIPGRDVPAHPPRTDLNETVKVAFVSGSKELMPGLIARMEDLAPGLPLYVVSEFRPPAGRWIPYHPNWSVAENLALCRARLTGKRVKFSAVILEPRMPYWRMRWIGFRISPRGFLLFNENLDHFMPRPRCAGAILGHMRWRAKSFVVRQMRPGGATYTFLWRLWHPYAFERPLLVVAARAMGFVAELLKRVMPVRSRATLPRSRETGISVIVPSRDGRHLLEDVLDDARRELRGYPGEIIVVDNGSTDGTREWLHARHPDVVVEWHAGPLSFAAAVNRGIARARYSHLCLLNNDMRLEADFFAPLLAAFERVPDLFSATAQILFPEGQRRQETGKAVKPRRPGYKGTDFPLWCDAPIQGENLSYVLYGSGGCSLYDADKLRRLGGFDAGYAPAYVEDLDVGFRAWRRGWPTVFVEGARVVHQHRATTSRFYSEEALEKILERNYLRFLARSVASPAVFRELWREARGRLNRMAASEPPSRVAMSALRRAWLAPFWVGRPDGAALDEAQVFALGSGDVAVFAGRQATGAPRVVVASPYLPFPLAHGGAVRIYNLMRCAASGCDQVLVAFVENLRTPPRELLDIAVEVVLVRLVGSHMKPSSKRPDEVEEFDSMAFRAALAQTVRKWRPDVVQLEYTQMAQYAEAAAPAKTILVEHDVTFDLYRQMLAHGEDWEIRRKFERWHRFETAAWKRVDAVAVMSEKDRLMVEGARAECLANGVDLDRFQPCPEPPDAARLLFMGSFAHLPNILAVEFFLREVWPKLSGRGITLHIIAGARHQFYLDFHRDRVTIDLARPGIEVEDFVADPRPAYRRATLVVAPLVASAGTNIKVMEAMAMGRVVVSTPAGVNGLDLEPGLDVVVEETGAAMAEAIVALLDAPERRREMERAARARVERDYDWRVVARRQVALYETLRAKAT